MKSLKVFIPENVAQLLEEKKEFLVKDGFILFCDIAGFTPLTERLSKVGKEGAERLTIILNDYFTEMINEVYKFGGDLVRFGGDAMTIFFDKNRDEESLWCAKSMMKKMEIFKEIKAFDETFSLKMKIGVAFGKVIFGILGRNSKTFDYYCAGRPLDDSAEAEHIAGSGEIVIHPSSRNFFKEGEIEGEFLKIRDFSFREIREIEKEHSLRESTENYLNEFLPQYLAERAGEGVLGEHRNTTVIFLGISGLKIMGENHSDYSDFHEKINEFYDFLYGKVSDYGGIINKIDIGDKGMKAIILFGSPFAIENKEEMAIRCAIDILRICSDKPLSFKTGITSSYLFSGAVGSHLRREFTVMGDGINTAARFMQKADINTIIVDKETYLKTQEAIEYKILQPIMLKGKAHEIEVFEVVRIKSEELSKEILKFIERDDILRELKNFLMTPREPILLTGEAGLGKTSLIEWLRVEAQILNIPTTRIFLAPYHKTRWYSIFRGPIRSIIGAQRLDPEEKVKELLINYLSDLGYIQYWTLLAPILGVTAEESEELKILTPKDKKELIFAIIEKIVENSPERLMLIDNLEYCDNLSLELLTFILRGYKNRNFKILATCRKIFPEIERVKNFLKIIELKPLSLDGIEAFVKNELKISEISKEVQNFLYSKSSGNPKLLKAFLDSLIKEQIVIEKEDRYFINEDRLFKTPFPEKVEDLYLQKVDKLSREERELVQISSILGYSVSLNLLSSVLKKEPDKLKEIFESLVDKDIFIYDSWGKRPYYKFKDSLLRDSVYNSLSYVLKKEIHLKCAQFLEEYCRENRSIYNIIAEHYNGAALKEKAKEFFKKCADDAISRFDNVSALKFLEEVCQTPSTAELEDFDYYLKLLEVYSALGMVDEEIKLIDDLEKFEDRLDEGKKLKLLSFKAKRAIYQRNFDVAEAIFDYSEKIAESKKDTFALGKTYLNRVGSIYGPTGQFEKARYFLSKALELKNFREEHFFKMMVLFNYANVLKEEGKKEEAMAYFKKAYLKGKRYKFFYHLPPVTLSLAILKIDEGEFRAARRWVLRAKKFSEYFSLRNHLLYANYLLALIDLSTGNVEKANSELLKNIGNSIKYGNKLLEALNCHALIESFFYLFQLKDMFFFGKKALSLFLEMKNGFLFKMTLCELLRNYIILKNFDLASMLLKSDDVELALKNLPPMPSVDNFLLIIKKIIERKSVDFDRKYLETIFESLKAEALFLYLEEAFLKEDTKTFFEIIDTFEKNSLNLNRFYNRLRFFVFLKKVNDKRAEQFKNEIYKKVLKEKFGIMGLFAIYYLHKDEKSKKSKRKLREQFIKSLYHLYVNSPETDFKTILSFKEIKEMLIGEL